MDFLRCALTVHVQAKGCCAPRGRGHTAGARTSGNTHPGGQVVGKGRASGPGLVVWELEGQPSPAPACFLVASLGLRLLGRAWRQTSVGLSSGVVLLPAFNLWHWWLLQAVPVEVPPNLDLCPQASQLRQGSEDGEDLGK